MEDKTRTLQQKVIRKASEICGSEAALARKLKVYPQILSRYSTGKRELPLTLFLKIKKIIETPHEKEESK